MSNADVVPIDCERRAPLWWQSSARRFCNTENCLDAATPARLG